MKGITNKKTLEQMKKENEVMGGIELFNLAKFLSEFDVGILYNDDDYIAIRLRITKADFEKKTCLKCLPICTQVNQEKSILSVYGHPGNELRANDRLPLSLSNGFG